MIYTSAWCLSRLPWHSQLLIIADSYYSWNRYPSPRSIRQSHHIQGIKKLVIVLLLFKNILVIYTTHHHVIYTSSWWFPSLSWHYFTNILANSYCCGTCTPVPAKHGPSVPCLHPSVLLNLPSAFSLRPSPFVHATDPWHLEPWTISCLGILNYWLLLTPIIRETGTRPPVPRMNILQFSSCRW